MRKFVGAMVGVALLAGAGLTVAAEETRGMIESIDAAKRTIRLDNGKNFKLDPSVTLAQLRMGREVTVSYEEKDGENIATKVVPASAPANETVNPPAGESVNPPAGKTGPAMREAPGVAK